MKKKTISDRDRLLSKIERLPNGCWTWLGRLDKDGYGAQWRIGSRTDGSRTAIRPHRFAYQEFKGPIPEGFVIDHICRNRHCVNPNHMEAVTPAENTKRGWRANKTECKHGHPLTGANLYIDRQGFRHCRECGRGYTRAHYRKTDGAAQKKFAEMHREERRIAQAKRRANWSPERLDEERRRGRIYDAARRRRRKSESGIN